MTCAPFAVRGRPTRTGSHGRRRAPEAWILGSSPYSARRAGQLGRPYAFALQFGDADVATAMRLYRENFTPSGALETPHALLSVSAVAHDDPDEARRQASSSAMAMLRMFQRKPFGLLPPDEVAAYPATAQERQVLDAYVGNTLHGTGAGVGAALEQLHARTGVDEIMLVVGGHSRRVQSRTVDLVADHFGMQPDPEPQQVGDRPVPIG